MDAVRKDITSLKSFQETVTKKLYELEEALIISQQTNPNSSIGNKPFPTDNFKKYKMKTNPNKIILEIL